MKYLLFTLLLTVSFTACHRAQQAKTEDGRGKLFIIGGGSRPMPMMQRMLEEAGLDAGGYIVILPMASSEPDSAVFYVSKQFHELGIHQIADFRLSPEPEMPQQRLDSILNASLIFITGGDQNRFMEAISGTPAIEAIRQCYLNGGMIAGTSAGAAVMSQKMITGNELKRTDYRETFRTIEADNIELGTGLGLLATAIVDQHFVWRSRHNRLITAVIENPGFKGIGIDEATAILVKGNTAEVVGESQVIVYENPDRTFSISENEKLGVRYLTMQVLLPGEKFRL